MKNKHCAGFWKFIFVLIFFAPDISFADDLTELEKKFFSAAARLDIAAENKDGPANACNIEYFHCTTMAFAKIGKNKYRFLTAAHCVATFNPLFLRTVCVKSALSIALEDENGEEIIYKAKNLVQGEMKNFQDFAIVEAEINRDIPIIPLSGTDPVLGEDILVATEPPDTEIGFLLLRGYVSREKITKDSYIKVKIDEDRVLLMNAKGGFGIQMLGLGHGFGTSGGVVFSVKRQAIVGIVSATDYNEHGHTTLLCVPISKFNKFYKEYTLIRNILDDLKLDDLQKTGELKNKIKLKDFKPKK